jgi:hypothetical protein
VRSYSAEGQELFPYSRSFLTRVLLFVGQLGWLWRVCALVWWSTFHGEARGIYLKPDSEITYEVGR